MLLLLLLVLVAVLLLLLLVLITIQLLLLVIGTVLLPLFVVLLPYVGYCRSMQEVLLELEKWKSTFSNRWGGGGSIMRAELMV